MIARARVVLLWMFVLLFSGAVELAAQRLPERRIAAGDVANEYIVGLRGVPREKVDAVAKEIAAKVDGEVVATWKHAVTGFWIRVPAERAAAMYRDARVASIEQNARLIDSATQPTQSEPTPAGAYPTFNHPLWHLARISHRLSEETGYQYQNAGAGVRAYTLDGGALRFHQEFVRESTPADRRLDPNDSPRMLELPKSNAVMETGGMDRLPSTAPHDDCSAAPPFAETIGGLRYAPYPWYNPSGDGITDHGTGVNSVLGGRNVGVAKEITLVPVKINGCGPTGTIAAAIQGANWILEQELDRVPRDFAVVSISTARALGNSATEPMSQIGLYETALENLVANGIPVFVSANNMMSDACGHTPAQLSRRGGRGSIISVGGLAKEDDKRWIDPHDRFRNGSNHGPCVDIIAPAEDIPVAFSTGWADYRPLVRLDADRQVPVRQISSGTSYSAPIVAGIAARMMAEDSTLRAKLATNPAEVSKDIWKRLIASATVLPEPQGAPATPPFGDNSPNRIAYMGAVGFVTHPQSYDFAAGVSTRQLSVEVAPGATVCGYEWFESTTGSYASPILRQSRVNTNARSSTFNAPRPADGKRTWYWARVYTCTGTEHADSAMAALSQGCAVITQQPISVWRKTAGPATLTIAVQHGGTPPAIEWYRGVRGVITTNNGNKVGAGSSLTIGAADADGTFWARVTGSGGCIIDSDVAQVRRCLPPDMTGVHIEPSVGSDPGVRLHPPPLHATEYRLWLHEGTTKRVFATDPDGTFEVRVGAPTVFSIEAINECGYGQSDTQTIYPDCFDFRATTPSASSKAVYQGESVTLMQHEPQTRYIWLVNGAEDSTLTTNPIVPKPTTHTTYAAKVKCGDSLELISAPVTVYVRPHITKHPEDTLLFSTSGAGVRLSGDGQDVAGHSVTYQWFEETPSGGSVALTDSFELGGTKTNELTTRRRGVFFLRVTSSDSPFAYTDTKRAEVTACGAPRRRSVRSSSTTDGVPPGSALTLSVEDDGDGTEFQWFEGTSYNDESRPVPGTSTAIVIPNADTAYWVKMTRSCDSGSATEVTPILGVTVQCKPAILTQPQSVAVQMIGSTTQASASVVAGGEPPLNYQWFEVGANGADLVIDPLSPEFAGVKTAALTWIYTVPSPAPKAAQKKFRVKVTGCNDFVFSDVVTLTIVQAPPQRIAHYTEMESVYTPLIGAKLSVTMDPPEQDGVHEYGYEWFLDDGSAAGLKDAGTASTNTVKTDSIANYWVRITGTHTVNGVEYTEVTTSKKMHVYLYGTCELPPVLVTQSIVTIPAGSTPNVTFTAVSDWHDVKWQWYRGQTGDTRDPVASDAGKAHQLTVGSASIRPYWVRAWLECGGTQDSPTLTFTRGNCGPLLMNQNITSSEVRYGGTAILNVDPVPGALTYSWFRRTTANIGAGSGSVFHPSDFRETRRYFVRAQNSGCGTMAESYLATVRVAECDGLTPPAWQTEAWADLNTPLVLNAQTGGATAYQWYRGEVGDETQKIDGATGATYTVPPVTADAQYWVRITNATCLVDSPTINVKVCVPPGVSTTPIYNYNILANQTVRFSVNAVGTGNTYQWYRGQTGDMSTPAGQPVDMLQASPSVTTSYWLRITGRCGINGNNVKHWNSQTFTASVCPFVPAPTAAKSAVMPGTTTTISVAATGTSLSYRWYRGVAGNTSDLLASGPSNTITTPAITAATSFWVQVTSGGCTRNSTAVTVNLCSEPTVRWSGGDKSIAKGDSVTLTAIGTHSTTTPTYTFYKGNAGDVAGSTVVRTASTSNTYTATISATAKYWVRAAVDNCSADSPNLTVTVCIPKITTQPAGATITLGNSHALSVATDITPSGGYQWYIGETGDLSKPIANGTTASISVSPTVDTKYWVRVKGCSPYGADSTAVLVAVCTPPAISSHTQSQWLTKGQSQTLSVAFTGTAPTTVQWYRGAAGNTTTPIASTTSTSVSPIETTQYWARVSNGCGSVNTATITISVCAPPVITTQPQSQGILSGTTATLSVAATQATQTPMTYQWYSGTAPSGTAISGATGTTYTTPPLTAAASYFVKITAGNCTTVSQTATITMCALPPAINSPDDKFVSAYTNVVLKVVLSPAPEQYRWYRGISGDRTNLISTSSQVTVNPGVTTKYWGEFIHGGCTSIGRTVTINVCVPSINMQPDSVTIPSGSSTTLTINARDAVSYQWYAETETGSATPISGATGPSYTTPELTQTTGYWVRVMGSCNRSVDTNVGWVTVE